MRSFLASWLTLSTKALFLLTERSNGHACVDWLTFFICVSFHLLWSLGVWKCLVNVWKRPNPVCLSICVWFNCFEKHPLATPEVILGQQDRSAWSQFGWRSDCIMIYAGKKPPLLRLYDTNFMLCVSVGMYVEPSLAQCFSMCHFCVFPVFVCDPTTL